MRLASYNILNGGEGRADPLAEVLLAQRPDIVVLVEADDEAVMDRISMRLGMDFIQGPGKKHSSAILSRWPIVESVNHALLRSQASKSLLEPTMESPSGERWVVGAVHLRAGALEADEAQREMELEEVLEAFASYRKSKTPHLIAGDFNSNSPVQEIDPTRCKPATRESWEANGRLLPRRVVQRMQLEGYLDALEVCAADKAAKLGSFTTQYPGQRVDYVFGFGLAKEAYQSAWIEQDRLAKYASDHFPVGVEIAGAPVERAGST